MICGVPVVSRTCLNMLSICSDFTKRLDSDSQAQDSIRLDAILYQFIWTCIYFWTGVIFLEENNLNQCCELTVTFELLKVKINKSKFTSHFFQYNIQH